MHLIDRGGLEGFRRILNYLKFNLLQRKMEYNTQREKMFIPEYGRNVQKMIHYVVSIEDREERNRTARFIVSVMANMHPTLRETNDFEHKLWDHMHIMADYKLDVDGAFDKPEAQIVKAHPNRIPYSEDQIRYKHYGKNMEKMIQAAIDMEEGEEKSVLVTIIANHMKKSYLNWNRDAVRDDLIIKQLDELSDKQLHLAQDVELTDASILVPPQKRVKKKKQSPKNSNPRRRNYSQRY